MLFLPFGNKPMVLCLELYLMQPFPFLFSMDNASALRLEV